MIFPTYGYNPIFPQAVGFVNDFEGVLTSSQIRELNRLIIRHENTTSNQIAIVTIHSIEPYEDINEYSIDLANYWRIGHNDNKNDVLLLLVQKKR